MNTFNKTCVAFIMLLCDFHFGYTQNIEPKVQLLLSTGFQHEDLRWSIAGNSNGQNPNILSELKWKNVTGQDYGADFQWNIWRRIAMFANYHHENIKSGSVNDMDYNGDNRTSPIYTGNFSDNKGYTASWFAGAGYIVFNNKLFSLIPYIGYGNNTQSLYIVDLTGQFPGLNSIYQTHWNGGAVGVKSSLKICTRLKAAATIVYNQINYSGEGNWNLINEFQHPVSYRHNAQGYGLSATAALNYNFTPNIALRISYAYFNWQTGTGNDFLYLSSGQTDKTRLNEVVRNGYGVFAGAVLEF